MILRNYICCCCPWFFLTCRRRRIPEIKTLLRILFDPCIMLMQHSCQMFMRQWHVSQLTKTMFDLTYLQHQKNGKYFDSRYNFKCIFWLSSKHVIYVIEAASLQLFLWLCLQYAKGDSHRFFFTSQLRHCSWFSEISGWGILCHNQSCPGIWTVFTKEWFPPQLGSSFP